MVTILASYKDGNTLTWIFHKNEKLQDVLAMMRSKGVLCRVVISDV